MKKGARLGPHSGSELGADFTPWTQAAYAESMAVDDDESEAEAEVEEGLALHLGFNLSGSACGSSSTGWRGQCGSVPMVTGVHLRTLMG